MQGQATDIKIVSDLLYVGRQTREKLQKLGIRTIGELAESDETMIESHFGKMGIF